MREMKQGSERPTVVVQEWGPTSQEATEKFFEEVVPELRDLKARHLEALRDGAAVSEEHLYTRLAYLEHRLQALKPGDAVCIARVGSRLAGFILVRWDAENQRTKLEQFYVDPELRSQGIGTKILNQGLEHARHSHADVSKGVFLSTAKGEQNRARTLYERNGFHESSARGDLPEEDRFDLDF